MSFALLCRSRSFVVPGLVSLLSLFALALSLPVWAQGYPGSYVSSGCTGGKVTLTSSSSPNPYYIAYANDNDGYGGGYYASGSSDSHGGNITSGTATCSGAISETYTWNNNGNPNNKMPKCVVITQYCAAGWSGSASNGATETGGCTNPLGGSSVPNVPGPGAEWDYTKYTVQNNPPATIPLSCSPEAHANSAGSSAPNSSAVGGGNVNYDSSISPVALNLTGPTRDSSGNLNILVGQGCKASLSGLPMPSGSTVTYQWTVSGNKFQSWNHSTPANPNASSYVSGPGPLTNPTAHWYWDDPGPNPTSETVTCTATVTPPPAALASPYTVTLTVAVSVQMPKWNAVGLGGYMQVNKLAPSGNYELWAGPTDNDKAQKFNAGMNWQANVTTPPLFGTGSLEFVQIVTPSDSYTALPVPAQSHTDPLNTVTGLDKTYPYGVVYTESPSLFQDNDSPGIHLVGQGLTGNLTAYSATFQSSFTNWLMYQPPGSDVQWVPMGTLAWSTNGSATIPHPSTGDWSGFNIQPINSGAAGTVSYSDAPTPFTPITAPDTFPSWTTIDISKAY